jgi:predicted AAA+ superfamily ATPase
MDLNSNNPWWTGASDKKWDKWNSKPIKWIPYILDFIKYDAYGLYFLTGPRQVGKSTAINLFIHRLLDQKIDPFAICYCSCEYILDFKELAEVIQQYLSVRHSRKIGHAFLFIDEITYVNEWRRSIKALADEFAFEDMTVLISGSCSMEILKEKESFPGRRGCGFDIVLYPLSFSEYVRLFIPTIEYCNINADSVPNDLILKNLVFKERLNRLFNDYLITGGFAPAIHDYYLTGEISQETYRIYLDWIRGDLHKLVPNELYLKEIVEYLLSAKNSAISWLSIKQHTSIDSPHTVEKYIDAFEKIYLAKILYWVDQDGHRNTRKNKKIHFNDPFLIQTLAQYTNQQPTEDHIVESVVAAHFSRIFPVYFWQNGSEVDVIVKIGSILVGYEIKWGPKKAKRPFHLKKWHLLTKDIIPLFLATVDWRPKSI